MACPDVQGVWAGTALTVIAAVADAMLATGASYLRGAAC